MTSSEIDAPGWAAIDAALARLYPQQIPHQFASKTAYDLESASPLPAVAVYAAVNPHHWHAVTYGLSELFEKTSDDPARSGFGFELAVRVPRDPAAEVPPAWPVRLLQSLGRYVLATRQGFDTGHRADLGGSLIPGQASALSCLACIPDPLLGQISTPFGALLFLQVVGLTPDELQAMQRLGHAEVVHLLAELDFYGITDPARSSYFGDPKRAPVLRRYQMGVLLDR